MFKVYNWTKCGISAVFLIEMFSNNFLTFNKKIVVSVPETLIVIRQNTRDGFERIFLLSLFCPVKVKFSFILVFLHQQICKPFPKKDNILKKCIHSHNSIQRMKLSHNIDLDSISPLYSKFLKSCFYESNLCKNTQLNTGNNSKQWALNLCSVRSLEWNYKCTLFNDLE